MITEEYALPSSGMSDDLMSKTGWCDDVRYIGNGEFVVTEGKSFHRQ